jgi:ABC-type microcin C transport system duplicated ATPase subunit YejF
VSVQAQIVDLLRALQRRYLETAHAGAVRT